MGVLNPLGVIKVRARVYRGGEGGGLAVGMLNPLRDEKEGTHLG